ncbi:hypothetical protein BCR42DRAFT_427078 [Absidia repens]|uniref:C2H2-type domain-containing protein n=1 Tax=Absidia repens TaxID=90262 RepID=A0A1X2I0I3_9FUNG|nr:hypothetical protein BCR42DRAFT_427078 [Absidia repens]
MIILDDTVWSTCSDFGAQLSKPNGEEKDLLDNILHRQKLEHIFCNDFICCGQYWTDLHNLLQHCEECHTTTQNDSIALDNEEDGYFMDDDKELPTSQDEDEEDEEEILTPLSPIVSAVDPLFLPQHITNNDLTALENSKQSASMMRPYETQEEYGYEKIKEWMHQAQLMPGIEEEDEEQDDTHRPYRCLVFGCDKAYKNANGLKYHKAHGHCHDKMNENLEEMAQKPYMCSLLVRGKGRFSCGKRYKNLNGLKYHIQHGHFKHRRLSSSSSSSSSSASSSSPPQLYNNIPLPPRLSSNQ